MKKEFRNSIAATALIAVTISGLVACNKPDAVPLAKVTTQQSTQINNQPENILIKRLSAAHLIDEVKGFVVERKQDMLFVNGKSLDATSAQKYLQDIDKGEIRVEVYPFIERLKQHPNASLLQIMTPMTFSSSCVSYQTKKPGC
jgi:hypothetical protein